MRIAKRNFQTRPTLDAGELLHLVEIVLAETGTGADSVSFVFVGDAMMILCQSSFVGSDTPTDVLAFIAEDPDPTGERDLGDVVLCTDQAVRQSRERGNGYHEELQILALHGLLHLLGFDHERDSGEMRALELRLRPRIVGPQLGRWHRGS